MHFVTFMNEVHRMFAVLQTSAEAHGLYPHILGYGRRAWWPAGLGVKINMLRDFVNSRHVRKEDVVVFADAFDVIVFGGEEEIVEGFLDMERRHGRSLFFNAEVYCYPRIGGLCEDYPPSPTHWRYLNSGLVVGRAWALRELLRDPAPEVIQGGDQAWYQRQFRSKNHSGLIDLDRECRFLCAVSGDGTGLVLSGDHRLVRSDTGYRPPLVHFAGTGHWTQWPKERDGATSVLADIFGKLYPDVARRLLDPWRLELQIGTTHDIRIYKGEGFWSAMALVLCIQCNVLGSGQQECQYFSGLLCPRCVFWSLWALSCCALLPLSCVLLAQLRRARGAKSSKPTELMV